ncbi:MAG TPA: tRNA (N6-threonylcarbamoyladenosine(37)-N6)-methyltransferase TrmO [Elusimicrobia bacterium]|nr:tRNA (N6-threonylcarbamoyladenosine(37)-N6)-methyltransferase TrmO [Elusimicrobiota bacterium]HBT60450.1 tRNA (N6-threonylcarbamoyladenosine(37)-N6)-methyltransferase TrmO [Elusimicrobiota bacterium]
MQSRVIGVIESCFREKFGTPRQGALVPEAPARLRIRPEFMPEHALQGLEEFSHVWLLFEFHLNTNKVFRPKIHPPRLQGKTVGLFASRSPHRPTPIGLTLARLERIQGDTLYLSGVDLVNSTPILDVKPYISSCDRPVRARTGWVRRCRAPRMRVRFAPKALEDISLLVPARGRARLKRLISKSLSHDPRNPRDRAQLRPEKELAFFILHYDAYFRVSGGQAIISRVTKADEASRRRPPLQTGFWLGA